jgi:hypothetical protein
MLNFETQERRLDKYRRKYLSAIDDLQHAVSAGAMFAAVAVIQADTDTVAEHAVRKELAKESVSRKVLDASGQLVASVARSALAYPTGPEAFDIAVYSVASLLLSSWSARPGVSR